MSTTKQPELSRLESLKKDLVRMEKSLINIELHPVSMDNQYRIIDRVRTEIAQLEQNRGQV